VRSALPRAVRLAAGLCAPSLCAAQDLEPRRWTHLPVGTDVAGVGYVHTTGDLAFDPVLRIEDAEVELHTGLFSYTRYFALGSTTARIDAVLPVHSGEWDGLVDGAPRAVDRDGLGDPTLRFSVNLVGAPALSAAEFPAWRREHGTVTTVGAALLVRLPLGEYDDQKLINLGQNRFVLGTQLGVLHTSGEWSFELTGTAFLFEDNSEFFGGHELEQDPLFAAQGHVVKTFGQDWWLSGGAAYGFGGESTIDGDAKDDERSTVVFGGSFGFRVADAHSIRLAYARVDTQTGVGEETDSVFLGWSFRF